MEYSTPRIFYFEVTTRIQLIDFREYLIATLALLQHLFAVWPIPDPAAAVITTLLPFNRLRPSRYVGVSLVSSSPQLPFLLLLSKSSMKGFGSLSYWAT